MSKKSCIIVYLFHLTFLTCEHFILVVLVLDIFGSLFEQNDPDTGNKKLTS